MKVTENRSLSVGQRVLFRLAQTHEEQQNYPSALHLYRICVDFLLEELMFAQGTDQSRIYLREKCTAIMDRIDLLKGKLEPIVSSATMEQSATDQLESLHLSTNLDQSSSTNIPKI